jgi:FtsH-binding integral membrane protein
MAYDELTAPGQVAAGRRTDARAVFGQVMGLVAITVGFTAVGAYVGRDLSGGWGIACFVAGFVCLLGLNVAAQRSERLAITLLFAFGLLLGLALGPTMAHYVDTNPAVVWQAAGCTALFIAALGSWGYATRRDLSRYARYFFFALLGLIAFGIVAIFVTIPAENVIYAVLGLVIFGGLTAFDFQRLRHAGMDQTVPIAAGIFLDVLNVFQFFLLLLGGGRN